MSRSLTDISCTFLPGRYGTSDPVPILYNKVYWHWREVWGEIFASVGSPGSLSPENFLRQDVIIAMHRGDEVVGIVCVCFFNLSAEPTFDHPYLRSFPGEIMRELRVQGAGLYATYEYISVRPAFRKSQLGIPLSAVLLGLCEKVFTYSGAKVALATAVRPARIAEILKVFGWSEIGSANKYGLDCVLLRTGPQTQREHEDRAVCSLIDSYWESKTDWVGLTNPMQRTKTGWMRRAA